MTRQTNQTRRYETLRNAAARSGLTVPQLTHLIELGALRSYRLTPGARHLLNPADVDDLMSTEQVAQLLSCSVSVVRAHVRAGRLPTLPRGGPKAPWRFRRSDIERALQGFATVGTEVAGIDGNGANRAAADGGESTGPARRLVEVAR